MIRYYNKHACKNCKCKCTTRKCMEIDFSKDCLIKGMNAKMRQKAKAETKDKLKPQRTFKVKMVVRYILHLDQKKMDNRKYLSEHPTGTIKRALGQYYFQLVVKLFLGSFFFFMGYTLRNNKKTWRVSSNKYFYLLTVLFVSLVAWLSPSSMPTMSFEKIIPYTISALLASASLLTLVSRINMNSSKIHHFINYVGSHTLSILTWHFLSFKSVSLIIIMIYDLPLEQLAYYHSILEFSTRGWWIIYTIVGVIMPLCLYNIYSKLKTYKNAHL